MTTPNAGQQHRFSIKQVVPALAAALAVALILCVCYDWWPLARNFENDGKLVFLALAAALLLAAGISWVVLLILAIRRRQWTWAVAVAPGLVAAGAVLAVYPGPTTFSDERPAFDQLVQRTMASPDKLASNIKIGPFDVTAIEREDGGVYVGWYEFRTGI